MILPNIIAKKKRPIIFIDDDLTWQTMSTGPGKFDILTERKAIIHYRTISLALIVR